MPQSSSVAGTTPSYAANAASPWTVTPASWSAPTTRGRNVVGDRRVDQQRLGGVADAGALGLGVEHDRQRPVEVGRGVDVDVAVADAGLDHRHRRLLDHRADQAGPAARDQHVDQPAGPHQLLDRCRGCRRAPAARRRRAARPPPRASRSTPTIAALAGAGAGASRAAAPRCPTSGRCPAASAVTLGRRLVDHPDHAERHPHLAQLEPVGERAAAHHLAHRVGQPGHVAQPLRPSRRPAPASAGAGRRRWPACRPPRRGRRPRRWPPAPRRSGRRGRRPWRAAPRPSAPGWPARGPATATRAARAARTTPGRRSMARGSRPPKRSEALRQATDRGSCRVHVSERGHRPPVPEGLPCTLRSLLAVAARGATVAAAATRRVRSPTAGADEPVPLPDSALAPDAPRQGRRLRATAAAIYSDLGLPARSPERAGRDLVAPAPSLRRPDHERRGDPEARRRRRCPPAR